MKNSLMGIVALRLLAGLGLSGIGQSSITHAQATAQPDVAALKEEVDALKRLATAS